jgi:hypothetical protein
MGELAFFAFAVSALFADAPFLKAGWSYEAGAARKPAGPPPVSSAKRERYQVNGESREFLYFEDGALLISAGCAEDGKLRCHAVDALTRATIAAVPPPLLQSGGAEPGALVCEHSVDGVPAPGRREAPAPAGGEVTFCVFSDGSMVSAGSLNAAAHRHGNFERPLLRKK